MFSCDGLTENECVSMSYCGWCHDNTNYSYSYCKSVDRCLLNSTENCEAGTYKSDFECVIDKFFVFLLILMIQFLCAFILIDRIKRIIRKGFEFIEINYSDTNFNSDTNDNIQNISEKSSLLVNSEKVYFTNNGNGNENNNDNGNENNNDNDNDNGNENNNDNGNVIGNEYDNNNYNNEIERKLNIIANKIGSIIVVITIIPGLILYYYDIYQFLVYIFFYLIFIIFITCCSFF
jgi:hypothetical protein